MVVVAVATGEASRTVGDEAGAVAVVTTAAVVAMNPEVVEVAVEAEAAWGRCFVSQGITSLGWGCVVGCMNLQSLRAWLFLFWGFVRALIWGY